MCGIAGVVRRRGADHPVGSASLVAATMANVLGHRGPDDAGTWESPDATVALAHRRLSIVDLSALGHNPMPWDGGRLWITFNGEIYNFRELRNELESQGHRFRSQTDTEVVLAAYDQWGVDSVNRLVGMFAFAVWDEPRKRLWVVRDRLGKKPLYYAESPAMLRFASELKAIVADRTFSREIDRAAVALYLRYGYVPSPHTIFVGARKLPPAHYLLFENNRVSLCRYWDPLEFATGQPQLSLREAELQLDGGFGQPFASG